MRLLYAMKSVLAIVPGWFALTVMVVSMVCAQVLYKACAVSIGDLELYSLLKSVYLVSGVGASFIGMLFWLIALKKMPLSRAYPCTALIYIITPFLGFFYWDEHLTFNYFLGLAFIVLGIVITTKATANG